MSLKRKIFYITIIAAFHFFLSGGLFLYSLGRTMGRIDSGESTAASEVVVNILVEILTFPVSQLIPHLKGDFVDGLFGYIPFVLNSVLWAIVFFFLIVYFRRENRKFS